jgi:hypothetical protein
MLFLDKVEIVNESFCICWTRICKDLIRLFILLGLEPQTTVSELYSFTLWVLASSCCHFVRRVIEGGRGGEKHKQSRDQEEYAKTINSLDLW